MSVSSPLSRDLARQVTLLASACVVVNIVGCTVIALVVVSHLCFLTNLHMNVMEDSTSSFDNKTETLQLSNNEEALRGESRAIVTPDVSQKESTLEDPARRDPVVELKMMTDEHILPPGGSPDTLNMYEVLSFSTPDTSDPAKSATSAAHPAAEDENTSQNTNKKSPEVTDLSQTSMRSGRQRKIRRHRRPADLIPPTATTKKSPLQYSRDSAQHREMRRRRRPEQYIHETSRRHQDLQHESRP